MAGTQEMFDAQEDAQVDEVERPQGGDADVADLNSTVDSVLGDEDVLKALVGDEKPAPKPKDEPKGEAKDEPKSEPKDEVDEADEAAQREEGKDKQEAEAKQKAEADAKAKTEAEEQAKKARDTRDLELAERMSKLAQQEKRIRAQVDEAKQQAAQAEEKVKAAHTELEQLKQAAALFDSNPIRAAKMLQGLGLVKGDFRKFAERAIEVGRNPAAVLEEEIAALRAETDRKLETERKRLEDERGKEREAARQAQIAGERTQLHGFVNNIVAAGGEKFELVRAQGREAQLTNEMFAHYLQTGELVNVEAFLAHAEDLLEKELDDRVAKTGKFSKKYTKAPTEAEKKAAEAAKAKQAEEEETATEEEPVEEAEEQKEPPKTRTLSNKVTPTKVTAKRKETGGDAFDDAFAEALDLLEKGKL